MSLDLSAQKRLLLIRRMMRSTNEANTRSDRPEFKKVDFGDLRRIKPISRLFGGDRGPRGMVVQPIDRYYLLQFLREHQAAIRGDVLEVGDDLYASQLGEGNVRYCDILNVSPGYNPRTSIVADLADAPHIPAESYDCIIVTQTLQYVYALDAAVETMHRILKPDGVALVSVPGISQISRWDSEHWGEYWRFTAQSAQRLFCNHFPPSKVDLHTYGNVLSSIAFLEGLAAEELDPEELNAVDPSYQVIVCVAAQKESGNGVVAPVI